MSLVEFALLAATGLFCGVVNTLAGGGSLIAVPMLIFLGIPATVANATNRPALVAQNIAAVAGFWRGGAYADAGDRHALGWMVMAALPGAALGAGLGYWLHLDPKGDSTFQALLALVLIGVALNSIFGGKKKLKSAEKGTADRAATPKLVAIFFALGIYMGFIQAGIGFVLMATLVAGMGWPMARVNATKVFVVGVANLVALIVFAFTIRIDWAAAAALVFGQTLGGYLGSRISLGAGDLILRRIYLALLFCFAAGLLWRAL